MKRANHLPVQFDGRYWIHLPVWLAASYTRGAPSPSLSRRFLQDTLWGQYCIVLAIRIEDDLFDGQWAGRSLAPAATDLRRASLESYARHFSRGSRFWRHYRRFCRRTAHAILEVDTLQRTRRCGFDRLLRGYAEVGSVFKIGAAAVCVRARRSRDLQRISEFGNALARAGQIIDDLEDLREDLEQGRLNGVARFVLAYDSAGAVTAAEAGSRIVSALARTSAATTLVERLRAELRPAVRMAKRASLPEAAEHTAQIMASFDALQAYLHRWRVTAVFGTDLVERARARRGPVPTRQAPSS